MPTRTSRVDGSESLEVHCGYGQVCISSMCDVHVDVHVRMCTGMCVYRYGYVDVHVDVHVCMCTGMCVCVRVCACRCEAVDAIHRATHRAARTHTHHARIQ